MQIFCAACKEERISKDKPSYVNLIAIWVLVNANNNSNFRAFTRMTKKCLLFKYLSGDDDWHIKGSFMLGMAIYLGCKFSKGEIQN